MAVKSYGSSTDEYQTPKHIFQPILDFIGIEKFDIDVCCDYPNIPAKRRFNYSVGLCGLSGIWTDICFMNPPWSKTKIWLEKAISEVNKNDCEVWSVLPGDRLNMKYFNEILNHNNNWFIAVLQNDNFNFHNPTISEEKNQANIKNGGFKKPIIILYIGKNAAEDAEKWKKEQPLKSLVLRGN